MGLVKAIVVKHIYATHSADEDPELSKVLDEPTATVGIEEVPDFPDFSPFRLIVMPGSTPENLEKFLDLIRRGSLLHPGRGGIDFWNQLSLERLLGPEGP